MRLYLNLVCPAVWQQAMRTLSLAVFLRSFQWKGMLESPIRRSATSNFHRHSLGFQMAFDCLSQSPAILSALLKCTVFIGSVSLDKKRAGFSILYTPFLFISTCRPSSCRTLTSSMSSELMASSSCAWPTLPWGVSDTWHNTTE